MSNNPEHLLKLLEEEKRAREEAEKRVEEEKRAREQEKRAREQEKRAREEAEKRVEEEKRAREQEKRAREEAEKPAKEIEAKTKPFRKAIQDGSTLMLINDPFVNLQLLDQSSLESFKSDAFSALQYCVNQGDFDTLSKGFRIFFSLPIKCDIIPKEQIEREGKSLSQKRTTTTPKGTTSSQTDAFFDIEPNFESIPSMELDVWFKNLNAALQTGSKKAIETAGATNLLLKWSHYIRSAEPRALYSQSLESLTSHWFVTYILDPIIGIFKTSGIDVDFTNSTDPVRSRPDFVVSSRNESERSDEQKKKLFTQGKMPEQLCLFDVSNRRAYLVVEMKRMGLSALVDGKTLKNRSELNSLLKRCFVYMIVYHTDMVLMSDFETSILFELNYEVDDSSVAKPSNKRDFEEELEPRDTKRRATPNLRAEETPTVQNDDSAAEQGEGTSWAQIRQEKDKNKVCVPLRYRIMSMHDTKYTHQAIIASAIYSQIKAGDSGKLRANKQLTKLRHSATRTNKEFTELSEKKLNEKEKREKKKREKEKREKEKREKEKSEKKKSEKKKSEKKKSEKKSKKKSEKEKKEKDNVSRKIIRYVELSSKGLSVLQAGRGYWTQVYKINRDAIGSYFPWVNTNVCEHDAVLKVYDMKLLKRYFPGEMFVTYASDEIKKYVETMATDETECYKRIQAFNAGAEGDNRIRSPSLYDSGRCVLYRPSIDALNSALHVGFFLLISILEKSDCQMTDSEIVKDGVRQLKLLHSIGIEHGDIKSQNYFITHEGVQFFDFSHSRLYDGVVPEWRAQDECNKFRAIFGKRSKNSTADVSQAT